MLVASFSNTIVALSARSPAPDSPRLRVADRILEDGDDAERKERKAWADDEQTVAPHVWLLTIRRC